MYEIIHFNNRPLRVNNFSLQGPHRTFAEDIEVLDCGSIIDKNYDLKIKVGTYFEIIKLIKSKHKKLSSSGHSNLGRRYTHTSHLIALFINDAGEWMTVGFDGMGISSPDIYFKMDCNYLLRQEYLYPDINGSQLRTNRSKETIRKNIHNIYTERQLKLSVVSSSYLNKDQLSRFIEYGEYLSVYRNKRKEYIEVYKFTQLI